LLTGRFLLYTLLPIPGTEAHTTMKKVGLRDALERVQALVARETGSALQGAAEQQLKSILQESAEHAETPALAGDFLSREVTILLADLRGFTAVSESYPVAVVLEMLNRYLGRMSEIIFRNQGTIDKFMGDSIMVLFGAPVAREGDVRRAVICAVEMQLAMDELNDYHKNLGMPELYMGIGINTGTVMAGLLGSDLYSEYTVIGDEVNLTSRIESFSLRGQVLVSQATFERCRHFVETTDPMDVFVKGKAHPVRLREVVAIPSLKLEVPRQEIRRSPRIEVKIPFSYHVVEHKIVMPQAHRGTILDISYHGVLAEVEQELAQFSEMKLDLDLSLVGYKATDIYAKVLKTKPADGRFLSGIEFTSVSVQSTMNIQQFIHLLIQGSEVK
jgi:adenylate cyclase